ncbi:hypothetical protein Tasa_009_137 [Tanticharoenia sakaeratensis NBRC 103193]|jgi:hypothetical protein|uniref:DUF3429 domain-containing protein n=2 Tax=Tanticharoenia TaxID=444052 RepID=A0A0D6MIA5_9PROT|nr:hypothetical protein Tasa_009_137 [Tanticharoenia sakaeratensis NBRC 103193]GBQ20921.1 hypothetical protein AA103193_1551 [Tanticharoenia sakaeratensis NBRC 103193]
MLRPVRLETLILMKRLPLLAYVLGLGGLVPFVLIALAMLLFGSFKPVPHLGAAMLAYGGAILSFLGAVHWGLALEQKAIVVPGAARIDSLRLLLGVCPSLVAWIAVYIGTTHDFRVGVLIEIMGFIATYAVERTAGKSGALPAGYLRLRMVLTTIVCLSLAASLLAPTPLGS